MPRTFYRIVHRDPPTDDDFKSYAALGIPLLRDDPESRRLAQGISTYATARRARGRAEDLPTLGRYIAALEIPDGAPVRFERTTRAQGHYTLWGDPSYLRSRVVSVVPVRRTPTGRAGE